eukprot:gene1909-1049_t
MKKVNISANKKYSTIHKLPCHINYEGKSNEIESLFQIEKEENEKVSSFRGRPLRGKDIVLPKDVHGFVFENENDNKFKTTHQFDSLTSWVLDKNPENEVSIKGALDFFKTTLNFSKKLYSTEEKEGKECARILFVKLIKSKDHQVENIQKSIAALKLRKIHQIEIHRDTPTIRGLIYSAKHLLEVRSVSTADIFPNGIPEKYEFKTNNEKRKEKMEMKKKKNMKDIQKLTTFIDNKEGLKYDKLTKSPSKNKMKY